MKNLIFDAIKQYLLTAKWNMPVKDYVELLDKIEKYIGELKNGTK